MKLGSPLRVGNLWRKLAFAGALWWASACAPQPPHSGLQVLAAASCTPLAEPWSSAWEGAQATPIQWQWGASSALARQILDGAPGDVWISAHPRWIQTAQAAGALRGSPREVARGSLVVITASPWEGSAPPETLAELMSHWPHGARLALGDPKVPVGQYARQAWQSASLPDSAKEHWVSFPDARAVLRAVQSGEAHAGIVYRSDAASVKAHRLFAIPAEHHDPIVYWGAVLDSSPQPAAAEDFLEFLSSPQARILRARFEFL